MKVKPPFELVAIVWDDAASSHGWEHADEVNTEREFVLTIGFLFKEDEHYLHLCSTCDAERNTNSRMKIPKGMIVERAPVAFKGAARRGKHAAEAGNEAADRKDAQGG